MLGILAAIMLCSILGGGTAHASMTIPPRLTDVRGAEIDVAGLAARQTLIFVTLKTATCPVCHEQIRRLAALQARLRACGASFIVLAPGPADALRQVAARTGFPYPFVEDVGLALARGAGLAVGPAEIMPGFFHVNAEREIVWTQRGRSAARFGDGELLGYLRCGAPAGDLVAQLVT